MKQLSIETLESRCLLTASLFLDVLQAPAVSFSPREMVVLDDQILFSAVDELHGRELWSSDGTTEGTRLLKDIAPGAIGSDPSGLFLLEDRVYFTVGEKPWSSDGTPEGTLPIAELPETTMPSYRDNSAPVEYNGSTFFIETDFYPVTHRLVKGDGVTRNRIHDLGLATYYSGFRGHPGIEILNDMMFIVTNGFANDGGGLWTSDGTAAGTERFMEIDSEGYLVRMGDELFFAADDGLNGSQLWRTDGTIAGTVALTNSGYGGTAGSHPQAFVSFNNDLYFATANRHDHSPMLWRMEGRQPELVKEMPRGSVDFCTERGQIRYPIEAGGTLYFIQDYGTESCAGAYRLVADLWGSDGTTDGTQLLVSSIRTRTGREMIPVEPEFTEFQNELVFSTYSFANGTMLGRSDASPEGTRLSDHGCSEVWATSCRFQSLTVVEDQLFFFSNHQLWVEDTNGQQRSLTRDHDVRIFDQEGSPVELTTVGEQIFFTGNLETLGFPSYAVTAELWISDGSTNGTRLVKQFTEPSDAALPIRLTDVDGGLMFFARTNRGESRLWQSDGSNAGTHPVSDQIFSAPNEVIASNGKLFFDAAAGGIDGLWVFDDPDVGIRKLLDFPQDHRSELTAFDDSVYFIATDDEHGQELWKTDGTPEGTVLVTDIHSGPTSSDPSDLTVIGDTLYFAADDGIHGREIWAVEGQPEPDLVGDIDGDGVVGFSDFLVLSANFGVEANATREMGDLNDDQSIDFDDFLLLKENLGRTLPAV